MNLIIYLIFSDKLKNRHGNINATIEALKAICDKINFSFALNIINTPDSKDIDKNIKEYNNRVDYSKYPEDCDYNNYITALNCYQISNNEKQREAHKRIIEHDKNCIEKNNLYLILEDDVIISKLYLDNISNLLLKINEKEWDILLISLNTINDKNDFIDYKTVFRKILSKSCYFIKPKICEKLYEEMKIFKLRYRHLLCKFINDNDNNILFYNKNTFIEGTKLGLYPTSINPNNYLCFNNNYIQISKIYTDNNITKQDIQNAEEYLKHNEFDSPDIFHIMSLLYEKSNDYYNAKVYSNNALESTKNNEGYLQKNSEILNHAIEIWKYDQDVLEKCKMIKPKY
tara:strand:- start:5384 stop:6412 length:1029 start_codon:yes stop_codon:yes gene_type:complete